MVVSCSFPFHGRLANWSLPGETPLMAAVRLATLDRADVGTAGRGSKQHHMELLHRVRLWVQNYFGIETVFWFLEDGTLKSFSLKSGRKAALHCWLVLTFLQCPYLCTSKQVKLANFILMHPKCTLAQSVFLPKVNRHPQNDNGNAIRKPSHHSSENSCFFFKGTPSWGPLTMPWHADLPRFSGASKS